MNLLLPLQRQETLRKGDLWAKPDPYLKITYGKGILKTKTVNNTYVPEWSYTTNLNVTEQNPEYVILELFDDNIGKDDKLGNTSLNIKDLIKKQSVRDQWIALDNCKSGEILISYGNLPRKRGDPSKSIGEISSVDVADLTAKPSEVSAPNETQKIGTSVSSSISLPQTVEGGTSIDKETIEGVTFIDKDTKASLRSEDYELNLNVKKARNIEKKGIMGKPDPYVKVTYGRVRNFKKVFVVV